MGSWKKHYLSLDELLPPPELDRELPPPEFERPPSEEERLEFEEFDEGGE
jgi:hypothetical protein